MTIDLSTDRGKIRLLIPDRVESDLVFSDAEVDAFLSLEGDVRRAAALALETIASDKSATLGVTKFLGLDVDGAKASDAILKRAQMLRAQADRADDAGTDGAFDVAEMISPGDVFASRERFRNQLLRDAV